MELMDLGKVIRNIILVTIVVRGKFSFTPSIAAANLMGVCVAKNGREIGEIECDIEKRRLTKDITTESGETETVLGFIRKQLLDNGDAFAGASSRNGEDKKLFVLYDAAASGIKLTGAKGANRGVPIYN